MKKITLTLLVLLAPAIIFAQTDLTKKDVLDFMFYGFGSPSEAQLSIDFPTLPSNLIDRIDSVYYTSDTIKLLKGGIKCGNKYIPSGIHGEWLFYNDSTFKMQYNLMIEPPRIRWVYRDTLLTFELKEIENEVSIVIMRDDQIADQFEVISLDTISCEGRFIQSLNLKRDMTISNGYLNVTKTDE